MKKVLMVVALLLLATPVFAADVTVTATTGSFSGMYCPVTIGWSGAAEANSIRGFALVLTTDNGMVLDNIRGFMRGECNQTSRGFGIFPGRFRDYVNAGNPNWQDLNYSPLAPYNDLNSMSSNDSGKMVVELGTLFVEPNAPGVSGTLFVVDVNKESSPDCNLCIAVDATRGGVVKKDATAAVVTLPGTYVAGKGNCIKVSAPPSGVAVPNLVGLSRTAAITALTSVGLVKGVEANVAPAIAGQLPNNVNAQKIAAGTIVALGTAVDFNTVNRPIKYMTTANSLYVNWVNRNRPACWAYPRQFRGDADGKKLGTQWVSGNDLTILKAAITKAESLIPSGGYCADFDHKKLGTQWVSGNDLTILKAYITKAESLIPMAGNVPAASAGFSADPNYWYWCVPSGAVCPTGQYCAPVGVCPNAP